MSEVLPKNVVIQKKAGYHHGNLRSAIIEAAAQLIGEQKTLGFQLKEVAALVGTSQPALYKHFSGKHGLLVETAIVGYELQKQFRDFAIERAGKSPLSQALAIGYAYVHFAREHPGYFLLMKNLETDEIVTSPRYKQQRQETLDLIRVIIVDCVKQELFVETDLELIMTSLQATAFGLAHLYIGGRLVDVAGSLSQDKNLIRRVFVLSMGSLLTAKGRDMISNTADNPFI